MLRKLSLLFHTVKHLRWQQIWYRIPLLKKVGRKSSREKIDLQEAGKVENWIASISSYPSYKDLSFVFLNEKHGFRDKIDWDFSEKGLLWAYNLNYFEFLLQEGVTYKQGVSLLDDYIKAYPKLKIGHQPYPISLRLIFWIRFFLRHQRQPDPQHLTSLHEQAKELQRKLEYHLLGNHLLENAFALFFTGVFLKENHLFQTGKKLLQSQLHEQILPDGGHFELSPMYHQLLLYRLLDSINLARASDFNSSADFTAYLEQIAAKMLGWLQQMCFNNNDFPLFNDAARGIAPLPTVLFAYAQRLKIVPETIILKESGYRKYETSQFELFVDVGKPGPSYQPGHAHCDIFNFELQVADIPIIVDTGTSVYGGNPVKRQLERSTKAHNTVQIDNLEQNQIWAEFRMAKQAQVKIQEESANFIKAVHNGFYFKRAVHQRRFKVEEKRIEIMDSLFHSSKKGKAYFHFHPNISLRQDGNSTSFNFQEGKIVFSNSTKITTFDYDYAPEFGKTKKAKGLEVHFIERLKTEIYL